MHLVGVLCGVDHVVAAPAEALGAHSFCAVLLPQLSDHRVNLAGRAAVRLKRVGGDELAEGLPRLLRCIRYSVGAM